MVCVVFVTRRYIEKIEAARMSDNVVAEFNLSRQAPAVVPVIMEEGLRGPVNWGNNAVYAELGGKLYVDMSSDDGALFYRNDSSRRWAAAMESLEARIRQEAAVAALYPRKLV